MTSKREPPTKRDQRKPEPSEEFKRFERLTKRLLQVPKKDIEKAKKRG